jgi:hypothetical protein
MRKRWWPGVVVVCCVGVASTVGCKKADTGGRLAVSGTVKFQGSPLDQGTIEFTSSGGGPTVFTGGMIKDGSYSVPAEKGLPPGTYRVKISSVAGGAAPAEEMPGMPAEGAAPPEERIPAEYNSATTQEVTVTSDGPNKFDFDIK